MRLRGRFALWFSVAALVPIAAAALVTRSVLSDNYREADRRRRDNAELRVKAQLEKLEVEVVHLVDSIARRDNFYVGGALLDLKTYDGALPAQSRRRIKEQGERTYLASGLLDVLFLVGDDDVVIDAPHYRDVQYELLPEARQRASTLRQRAYYVREPVMDQQQGIRKPLTVQAAHTAADGAYQVHVIGGIEVGEELLSVARSQGAVDARIVSADGEVLVAPEGEWVADDIGARLELTGPDGQPLAVVELAVADAGLSAMLRQISLYSAGLALAAVAAMVLLGLFVARRMTRDLDALVLGTEAAARGEHDHQVPIRTKDEIGAVADAFNTMMVDLKESKERLVTAERVAAWQEMARHLAHEIKNPLTPIQMSVETMRKTKSGNHPSFDEIFDESTATILEEASRLKRIATEFSDFARLPKPQMQPLDLNELVSAQIALYQGSVEVHKQLEDELPAVSADKDCLIQVLLNLLENARDALVHATDASSRRIIRVSTGTARAGRAATLTVEDSGPGIPEEMRAELFRPYFTTKQATGGTGLGLAIVHRIISDHGGRISTGDSELGGARFDIELPVEGGSEADLNASASARWTWGKAR